MNRKEYQYFLNQIFYQFHTTYVIINMFSILVLIRSIIAQILLVISFYSYFQYKQHDFSQITFYISFFYFIGCILIQLQNVIVEKKAQKQLESQSTQNINLLKQILKKSMDESLCVLQFKKQTTLSEGSELLNILFESEKFSNLIQKNKYENNAELLDSIIILNNENTDSLSKLIRDNIQQLEDQEQKNIEIDQCRFSSQSHFNFQNINTFQKNGQTKVQLNQKNAISIIQSRQEEEDNQKKISIEVSNAQAKFSPLDKKKLFSTKVQIISNNQNIYVSICIVNEEKFNDQNSQIAELKNSIKLKDSILATVAHDFKSPINGMIGILDQLIQLNQENQEQEYFLKIIKKNIDLLLYMIGDLLDYQRIQNNSLKLCLSQFDLKDILQVNLFISKYLYRKQLIFSIFRQNERKQKQFNEFRIILILLYFLIFTEQSRYYII